MNYLKKQKNTSFSWELGQNKSDYITKKKCRYFFLFSGATNTSDYITCSRK